MSHEPKPSEHAMRAAYVLCLAKGLDSINARIIDQHAIAPAVAELTRENVEQARLLGAGASREAALMAQVGERDRRIAELEEALRFIVQVGEELYNMDMGTTGSHALKMGTEALAKSERSAP